MSDPDDFDEFDDDELGDDELDGPDDHRAVPLDRYEAASVRRDLDDLAAFRDTFGPEGYKGVSVWCTDCGEDHYYGWDMLQENLQALLASGQSPVHEPPFDPHPDDYVDWQYAQGYVDGLSDAAVPPVPAVRDRRSGCPFCAAGLPAPGDGAEVVYCPTCGTHLGTAKVAHVLREQGWSADAVRQLLSAARLPVPEDLLDER